jgi:hypothetical protein
MADSESLEMDHAALTTLYNFGQGNHQSIPRTSTEVTLPAQVGLNELGKPQIKQWKPNSLPHTMTLVLFSIGFTCETSTRTAKRPGSLFMLLYSVENLANLDEYFPNIPCDLMLGMQQMNR